MICIHGGTQPHEIVQILVAARRAQDRRLEREALDQLFHRFGCLLRFGDQFAAGQEVRDE